MGSWTTITSCHHVKKYLTIKNFSQTYKAVFVTICSFEAFDGRERTPEEVEVVGGTKEVNLTYSWPLSRPGSKD